MTREKIYDLERQVLAQLFIKGEASVAGYDFKVLKRPGRHWVSASKDGKELQVCPKEEIMGLLDTFVYWLLSGKDEPNNE